MKEISPIVVIKGCCMVLMFNTDNGQCRFYEGDEAVALQSRLADGVRKAMKEAGFDDPYSWPQAKEWVLEFSKTILAEAPSTAQVVSNQLLHAMGQPPVNFADLPHPPASHEQELAFLTAALEVLVSEHQKSNALGEKLAEAVAKAMDMAPDDLSVSMVAIPLNDDGTPDMARLKDYAPGSEAHDALRKQIEPNHVRGNSTIH